MSGSDRRGGGWRPLRLVLALLALFVGTIHGERAEAQFGFGYGWGMFQYRPQSVEAINANANIRASAAFAARQGQQLSDPGGRFAYRQQQIAMQDRYNFQTRQSFDSTLGRPAVPRGTPIARPSPPPSRAETPASPSRRPSIPPVTSFVNQANQVVWPADAPVAGDLGPKREESDQATVEVAQEYRQAGQASMTAVAEARKKLIDYGQPALQTIRQESTPAVADSFHVFLLTLYESLANAALRSEPPPIPSR